MKFEKNSMVNDNNDNDSKILRTDTIPSCNLG